MSARGTNAAPASSLLQSSWPRLCLGWRWLTHSGNRRPTRPRPLRCCRPASGRFPAGSHGLISLPVLALCSDIRHVGSGVAPSAQASSVRTIAYRFWKPVTSVGSLLNFCLNASLRLCAGSVEMIRTLDLTAASWTARLLEQVVFPTPPCSSAPLSSEHIATTLRLRNGRWPLEVIIYVSTGELATGPCRQQTPSGTGHAAGLPAWDKADHPLTWR